MNNKYIDSKIYKLIDNTNGNIYIGSTYKTIEERLYRHRKSYKRYLDGKYHYVTSFEIIKNEDYKIELIELCSFNNKKELLHREGYYIRNLDCVNKQIAGRTIEERKELNKEYRELNKEYRELNKDKRSEYRKQKYTCVCDSVICIDAKTKHFKSKKHIEYIDSITE